MYFDASLNLARQIFFAVTVGQFDALPCRTVPAPSPSLTPSRTYAMHPGMIFRVARFNCAPYCLAESVKDPVTECTRDRQKGSTERERERERAAVQKCQQLPQHPMQKSPDIVHIYIYMHSISTHILKAQRVHLANSRRNRSVALTPIAALPLRITQGIYI